MRKAEAEIRKAANKARRDLEKEIATLEEEIATLEAEKKQLEKTLADPASYGSSNSFQLNRQLSSILEKCELKSSRWDQLTTQFAAKYPEATLQESEQDLS